MGIETYRLRDHFEVLKKVAIRRFLRTPNTVTKKSQRLGRTTQHLGARGPFQLNLLWSPGLVCCVLFNVWQTSFVSGEDIVFGG